MKVEVVRSARRRKTVQARQVGGVLRITIPAAMTAADEQHWVDEMVRRMKRRAATDEIDLTSRAATLARRLGLRVPASIRWVDNQEMRWGSCTPRDGTIRISSKLAKQPGWVVDYVVVHELAHLSVSGHGPGFWALVNRYPLAERARGFLMARGVEPEEPDPQSGAGEPEPAARGPVDPGRVGRRPPHQALAGAGAHPTLWEDGLPGAGAESGDGRPVETVAARRDRSAPDGAAGSVTRT